MGPLRLGKDMLVGDLPHPLYGHANAARRAQSGAAIPLLQGLDDATGDHEAFELQQDRDVAHMGASGVYTLVHTFENLRLVGCVVCPRSDQRLN